MCGRRSEEAEEKEREAIGLIALNTYDIDDGRNPLFGLPNSIILSTAGVVSIGAFLFTACCKQCKYNAPQFIQIIKCCASRHGFTVAIITSPMPYRTLNTSTPRKIQICTPRRPSQKKKKKKKKKKRKFKKRPKPGRTREVPTSCRSAPLLSTYIPTRKMLPYIQQMLTNKKPKQRRTANKMSIHHGDNELDHLLPPGFASFPPPSSSSKSKTNKKKRRQQLQEKQYSHSTSPSPSISANRQVGLVAGVEEKDPELHIEVCCTFPLYHFNPVHWLTHFLVLHSNGKGKGSVNVNVNINPV